MKNFFHVTTAVSTAVLPNPPKGVLGHALFQAQDRGTRCSGGSRGTIGELHPPNADVTPPPNTPQNEDAP